MLKSILIITYGRETELYETLKDISLYSSEDLEILLLDNNQTDMRKEKIIKIFEKSKIKLRYFHDGINYGVALGRNYIIEKSEGEILITLDDDIEIKNINLLVQKIEKYFEELPEVGCLAFNIKNYYTRVALRYEIPHGNKKLDFSKNLETYYFIGAGHAIRKKVYEECGKYPDDLGKYGGEEEDLSYRIIEKYRIQYCADLEIYHKISPNGRMKKEEENYFRYRNKLLVRSRYLLLKYQISNYIIWSLYYLIKKDGKLKEVIALKKELKKLSKIEKSRKVFLNKKLKQLKARVLF